MNKVIYLLVLSVLATSALSASSSTCGPVKLQNQTLANLVINDTSFQRLMLSGYLNVDASSNSSLYFIFYSKITNNNVTKFPGSSLSDITNTPLIIWINGGPGASSMMGNFYENGPYQLVNTTAACDTFTESLRETGSWADQYNVMYVDQPIGTGASYINPNDNFTTNIDEMADQFFYALNELVNNSAPSPFADNSNACSIFKNISEYYISGESYGGKYVPAIAAKILTTLDGNKNTVIPLKGVSIGDGFTSPIDILSELGSFSYNLGLIDFQERIQIENYLLAAAKAIKAGNYWSGWNGFQNALGSIMQSGGGVNAYDLFNFTTYDGQVPGMNMTWAEIFLNNTNVKQGYQILPSVQFQAVNSDVTNAVVDIMADCMTQMQTVLNSKTSGSNPQPIKVLIYNGQDDLIVNNMGTMKWVDALNWNVTGASNFKNLDLNPWLDTNKNVVGYVKCAANLNFKIVNKAGHMVPFFQPVNAVNMITDFINNDPSTWNGC